MGQSRIENLLENILGAENVVDPQSRIEAILYAIATGESEIGEPYSDPPKSRIETLLLEIFVRGTVKNPALRLIDWEGTVLKEYTSAQVASLTALPEPSSLSTKVDRDLLTFQGWNWTLTDIKSWVSAHENECLTVGAIYTTTDGEDHNFWDNPIFGEDMHFVVTQKRGTESIGNNAFNYCTSLESINIPDSVTSIGNVAFQYCTSLKSINIPDSVTSTVGYTFSYCTSLKSISIPDSVTSIGGYTFNYCTSLKSINIPDSVTSIGSYTFNYCTSLKSINIPDSVTSIGNAAFQYCTSLKSINIPDSVTSIGNYTFQCCTSLESVNIPDTVTSIGNAAFQYCTSLKSINIPDSVTSIGGYAFNYCTSLKSINIPDSVTSIGIYTFATCTALNAIVINGKPELSNVNSFISIYSGCLFYVPRENLEWFETATNWATFYAQDKVVTIEDNVDFLRAIGINV